MRKLGIGAATLALALAVLLVSASAAQAAKLVVFGEQRGDGNESRNSVVFHEKLLNKGGEHVGRNRIEIFRSGPGEFSVRALFRFHGGKIRVADELERNTTVVPITNGKGRYHGIEGRLKVGDEESGLTKYTFRYSR